MNRRSKWWLFCRQVWWCVLHHCEPLPPHLRNRDEKKER